MSVFAEKNDEIHISCLSERWFDSINNLPPRGGASLITTSDFILVFGGANRYQEHFNDVWVYNKKKGSSKKKPKWMKMDCTGDVPPPRSGQSMCTYQNCVLLFGGMDSGNEAIYNDLYTLNTESWEWNYVGEAGETINARNSHSLHVISVPSVSSADANVVDYLVLFGGSSPERGPLGDTYYAELPAEGISNITEFYVTWKSLPDHGPENTPCPREMHSSALLPDSSGLLIAGGRSVGSVLSDVWLLSGIKNDASPSNLKLPDKNNEDNEKLASSNQEDDPATLISVLSTPDESISTSSIEVSQVQPQVKEDISVHMTEMAAHPLFWSRVDALELPHPRCAHTAVVSDGDLILFGGFTGQGISEDLIIAKNLAEIFASPSSTLSENETETTPSDMLSKPISAHWMCLEISRPIDGRFAHCMSAVSLSIVKKEETDDNGIIIFGGINATQDFNDVWILSNATTKIS